MTGVLSHLLTRSPRYRNRSMFETGASQLKLSAQVRSTHDRDGAVVLDILDGQMFRANLVGSRILELLRRGYPESEIAEKIAIEFCTEPGTVARDVQGFLAQLKTFHLLEVNDETSAPSALR